MALSDQRLPLYTVVMFETQGPACDVFNQEVFGKSYVDIEMISGITTDLSAAIQAPVELSVTKDAALHTNYELLAASKFTINRTITPLTNFTIEIYEVPSDVLIDFSSSFTKAISITEIKGSVTIPYLSQTLLQDAFTLRTASTLSYSHGLNLLTYHDVLLNNTLGLNATHVIAKGVTLENGVSFSYGSSATITKALTFKNPSKFTLVSASNITTARGVTTTTTFSLTDTITSTRTLGLNTDTRLAVNGSYSLAPLVTIYTAVVFQPMRTMTVTTSAALRTNIKVPYVASSNVVSNLIISNPAKLAVAGTAALTFSVMPVTDIKMSISTTVNYAMGVEDLINEHISLDITFNLASGIIHSNVIAGIASSTAIARSSSVNVARNLSVRIPVDFAVLSNYGVVSGCALKVKNILAFEGEHSVSFATQPKSKTSISVSSTTSIFTIPTIKTTSRFSLTKNLNVSNSFQIKVPVKLQRETLTSQSSSYSLRNDSQINRLSLTKISLSATLETATGFHLVKQHLHDSQFSLKSNVLVDRSTATELTWLVDLEAPTILGVSENVGSMGSSISLGSAVQISFNSTFTIRAKPWRSAPKIVDITLIKNDVNVVHSKVEWKALTPVNIERL